MRKYLPLSDRRILWLFRHGYYTLLNADSHTPEVYAVKYCYSRDPSVIATRRQPLRIRHQLCHRGYRHVRLHYRGRRASVALHKLTWMVINNSTVPPNHDVHHIKSKKLLGKCHDGIGNLELLDKNAHSDLHTEEFLNPPAYPTSWDDI